MTSDVNCIPSPTSGFFAPQGLHGILARKLPGGKLRGIVASTSLFFWLCLAITAVLTIFSVVAFGIIGLIFGLVVPILFFSMRYVWWRLVWEPFGSWPQHGEEIVGHTTCVAANRQLCCPSGCNCLHSCRSHTPPYLLATVIFWASFLLSVLGLLLNESVGHEEVDPPLFIVICWNTGGAIILLVVSVWVVDTAALVLTWSLAAGTLCLDKGKTNTKSGIEPDAMLPEVDQAIKKAPISDAMDNVSTNGSCVVLASAEEGDLCGAGDGGEGGDDGMCMEGRVVGADESESEQGPGVNKQPRAAGQWTKRQTSRVMAVCSVVVFIVMLSFSTEDSYGDPRNIHLDIPLRQLPPCMDGFKLALLTDVHAGSLVGDEDMRRIVELVQEWKPDAVAVSGDLGDQQVNAALEGKIAPLSALEATVPDGVFWTPGNHENEAGIQGYRDLFSPAAEEKNSSSPLKFIKTLENSYQSVEFSRRNNAGVKCSFDLAGLADASGDEPTFETDQIAPDLDQTLLGRDPSDALVLLNHQPVHFRTAARAGAGLVLSGHTHGGQLWPNHAILWFAFGTHISGLFTDSAPITNSSASSDTPAYLYVSEGTVGWGPRVRLLSYPEITLITLRNPSLFEEEGGSTAEEESYRAAVIGLFVGLVVVPLSVLVCIMRTFGCCWREESEAAASRGLALACGGFMADKTKGAEGQHERVHEV